MGAPARALLSGEEKTRRAGGAGAGGVPPPPPVNSLSRWQLTTSAASATGKRTRIAAARRCKRRTGSPTWNAPLGLEAAGESSGHTCRAGATAVLSARQVVAVNYGSREQGAGSGEQETEGGGGPAPCSLLPLQQASVHVRGLFRGPLPGEGTRPGTPVPQQLFPAQRIVRQALQRLEVRGRIAPLHPPRHLVARLI